MARPGSEKYMKMFQSRIPKVKAIKSIQVQEFHKIAAMKIVLTLCDKKTPIKSSLPGWCLESENKQFISCYVDKVLAPVLTGQNPLKQATIDKILDQLLANNSFGELEKVARNVNWAVSVAVCKSGAHYKKKPAYMYLADLAVRQDKKFNPDFDPNFQTFFVAPTAYLNVANGGLSSGNRRADQHLVISHLAPMSFNHSIRVIKKVFDEYSELRAVEIDVHSSIDDGDEVSSYIPSIKEIKNCLKSLEKIIAKHGLQEEASMGVNIGASKFYEHDNKTYRLNLSEEVGVLNTSEAGMSAKALDKAYTTLFGEFERLAAFEDMFHMDDKKYSSEFTRDVYYDGEVVITEFDYCDGFDRAMRNNVCNCLHLKVGEISSVTKSIGFVTRAKNEEWKIVMSSHDSCETSEPFLADFCVGLSVDLLKIGVSCLNTSACKICNRVRELEVEVAEEDWRRFPNSCSDHRVKTVISWVRNEGPVEQPCCDADVLETEKKDYFKKWELHGFD